MLQSASPGVLSPGSGVEQKARVSYGPAQSDTKRPSLMSALAEIERIRSVKDSLSEGISGLRLCMSSSLSGPERDEANRCLGILGDFCQSFLASVDSKTNFSESGHNAMSRSAKKTFGDIALYSGIISAFDSEERRTKYEEIKEIQGLTCSKLKASNTVDAAITKHFTTLEELYRMAESRIMRNEEMAERVILGGNATA